MTDATRLEQRCINTIRFLAVDGVQKANSGHPGAPMGMAPMAWTLWDRFLRHNPANPAWVDRDRFVLSAGHASMLLYSLLHLTGYDLSLDDLKAFRQWGSPTPGHPEVGEAPGVEMTTGPLGQGFAHGVGMAMAERFLAATFNRPGHEIVDHHVYAIVSDGDLEEGVSAEAASLAGTLGLGKLVYLYDSNSIQIDGTTRNVFSEDVGKRFEAYGWHVQGPVDGFDTAAVARALDAARAETARPSLVIATTVIGFGAPHENTPKVHGSPLGEAGVRAAKEKLGWPVEPSFLVPDDVRAHMGRAVEAGRAAEAAWAERFSAYREAFPDLAARFERQMAGELPEGWDAALSELFAGETKPEATRISSGTVINALAKKVDFMVGGSADLAGSTKTLIKGKADFNLGDGAGPNVHFGVREHVMGSIAGGMALHGGIIPFTGTFLTFSDYMRPPMRLAAIMKQRVVYVFTHDSIGLGEDGPTHQPVEHLMALRVVPNLTVIRPADARETAAGWQAALMRRSGPTCLVLTRQDVPALAGTTQPAGEGLHRGAYVLWESTAETPDVILIGTGSEVHVALEAGQRLGEEGVRVRVVSMPSWELFDEQPAGYRESVLPRAVRARVAVEAGQAQGWERWVGLDGAVVGMTGYGASAPAEVLYDKFGITADAVTALARAVLDASRR